MRSQKMMLDILIHTQSSKTITEVADKMYLSQCYVSRIIKKNEDECGVELVSRQSLPIALTTAGEVLLKDLKEVIQAQHSLLQHLKSFRKIDKTCISIAVTQPVAGTELPKMIGMLHRYFPDLIFKITDSFYDIDEDVLLNNKVDILIGKKWNNPAFTILELFTTPLFLLIPDSCPLFRMGRLMCPFTQNNLTTLNNCLYVGLTGSSFHQRKIDQLMAENGISVRKILELPDYISSLQSAIELKATTITTVSIAERYLPYGTCYNLMPLPAELMHIDIAISYLNNGDDTVRQVAERLKMISGVVHEPYLERATL